MTDFVLQGIACEFGKCFSHGDEIYYMKPGCFESDPENDIKLLLDHRGKSLGTTANRLDLHFGEKALAFRYAIPDSWSTSFAEMADELETYVPVSIGFNSTKTQTMTIDGEQVRVIVKATLNEVSIVKEPAVKSTYGRVVSLDTCGTLEEDHDSGRLQLVGRVIALHRNAKATENGGKVEYRNFASPSDKAADSFLRALRNFA